ncbi:MAG: hypothetical protein V1784_06510 [bacterium]
MKAGKKAGPEKRLHRGWSRARERGFTITELIMGMTLALIITAAATSLFQGVVRLAAVEGGDDKARADGRLIMKRLERNLRLTGLVAPRDADGDSDDITADVVGEVWSDTVRDDFEFAHINELIFMGDCDDDSATETIRLWQSGLHLYESIWQWSRDSVRWMGPIERQLANNVEKLLFFYFDRNGNSLPIGGGSGPLTAGERRLVASVEMVLIMRSEYEDQQHPYMSYFPDGTSAYDGYQRFWLSSRIRSRNLWLV